MGVVCEFITFEARQNQTMGERVLLNKSVSQTTGSPTARMKLSQPPR